jgi:hypothetical protein
VSSHFAHRGRNQQAALITSAPMSPDEEFYRRRRRYAFLMGTRALCVIAAVLTYRISLVLALALVAGGAILPWCAVIIANGRLLDRGRRRPVVAPGVGRARELSSARDEPASTNDRGRLEP